MHLYACQSVPSRGAAQRPAAPRTVAHDRAPARFGALSTVFARSEVGNERTSPLGRNGNIGGASARPAGSSSQRAGVTPVREASVNAI
jgi:hypothetical protein